MRPRAKQRGYLLVTVVMGLFLFAAIAVTLNYDSATSANTASKELETARADYVARAGLQNALWRAQNNACMGEVTIPDTPLGADTYAATLNGAAAGTLYQLTADQDAWIRSDDVTMNNGTTVTNHIRQELGNVEQVLARFDVSTLPAGAQINSAIAWFHLKALKTHPQGAINVHEVTADWTETAVTWESFAGSYGAERIAMLPAQDTGDVWVAINLTGLVQAWVNGQPNFGILFDTQAEGVHTEYTAREDGASPPRLEVVVGSGTASPVSIKANGKLANGVGRTLKDKVAVAYQPPGTVTLQLGTDPGGDAMLDSFYERNYGGADYLQINGESGWQQRPVLRFSLGMVPYGAKVLSANLELYNSSTNTAGVATVHRLSRGFIEGTQSGGGTADGATWETYNGSATWSSPGGEFDPAPVSEANIDTSSGWVSWDVTSLVDSWVNGTANDGLLIRSTDGLKQAKFASRENGDPALSPRLTIRFACECGTACMSQTGSGNILMVVAEKTGLGPADQAIKTMFEDWGYTIELISDHDNQNTFDGGIVRNDVAYVAESVDSTKLVSKVNAAPIGVVNGDGWMNDELGFESDNSSNWPVGSDITITDSSHYITAPLAAGSLSIYDADMGGLAIGNTPAPDLQSLVAWGTDTGLAVLESGALMADGGVAVGRRVMLPFGRDNSMDWSRLNNSGQLILQRAISWGMGAGTTSAGKLLLVVSDAASPLTSETDRKSLIESWGYEVILISDHAPQAEFDTALADVDVAYIAGSISSGDVNTKLTAATVGVLSEDIQLVDELGIAQPSFLKRNSQSIDIFDNTHYVTSGFSLGTLQLYSYVPGIWTVTGLYAPGLQPLAGTESSGSSFPPGLAVLETGAELWGGGFAAGRRVQVPWSEGSFDINALNDDGKTIMRRAIEWGAGADAAACTSSSPLLFVVGDATSPSTQETARQALLESWCYTVTLIDDSDSQSNFDTAATNADVAYISSEVSASALGTKLKDNSIGIVNEDPDLHNDYGFSTVRYRSTTNAPLSTDSAHYITSPFAGADITLFTSTQSAGAAVGTLPSGLVTLGSWTSGDLSPLGGLLTLETGAAISGGGTAAGRRVQMPWDGTEGGVVADIAALSADGQTVLQRSLEWVGGAGNSATGPIAHWKLDETGGTTAVDSAGGHDGTLTNMDPSNDWVAGELGGALDFDGSNDHIDIPYDSSLSITGEMSFTAWVNLSSPGSAYQTIVTSDDDGSGSNYWFGAFDDELAFGFSAPPSGIFRGAYTAGLSLQPDTWYHLGATFDDASDEVRLYVDGAEYAVESLSYSPTVVPANISVGSSRYGEYWRGLLDDVRIYDYVLDAADIAELAASGGGLVAHWKLDETSGTTAVDSIGGHDGTLIMDQTWGVGRIDGGLDFDGVDDTVDAGSDETIDDIFAGEATLTAWMYPRGWGEGNFGRIADKADNLGSNRNGWAFELYGANRAMLFQYGFSGSIGNWYTPVDSVSLDNWQHVAVVYDNSADTNDPVIYINGIAQTLIELDTPTGTASSDAAMNFTLGNYALASSRTFDGTLDDIRLYNRALSATEIADLAAAGGGGGGSGGGGGAAPAFEEFNDASASNNVTSLNVAKPGGTVAGDLLIAALATDGDSGDTFSPPSGWTAVSVGTSADGKVSFGVWWKIATDSEPSQYSFTWSGGEQAYGWISRFTGHDPGSPVYFDAGTLTNNSTSTPTCQRLNTPVDNMLVLRLGGFDDDDITIGNPGLDGHTAINMGESGTGNASTSGGSGYFIQETAGDSDLAWFQLTNNEQMRTVTLGIRPAP